MDRFRPSPNRDLVWARCAFNTGKRVENRFGAIWRNLSPVSMERRTGTKYYWFVERLGGRCVFTAVLRFCLSHHLSALLKLIGCSHIRIRFRSSFDYGCSFVLDRSNPHAA